MRKKILIVEAGSEYQKRHLVEETKRLPYDFYLLQTNFFKGSNDWVSDWFDEDRIINVDSMDAKDIYSGLLQYTAGKSIRFDGITTFWEGFVPITHYLQAKFNLPLICNGNIRKLRHKGMMRDCVSRSIMCQPKYRVLKRDDKVDDVLLHRKYPLIVKPAEMAASLAVKRVHSDEELNAAIELARTIDYPGYSMSYRNAFNLSDDVLVEEYIGCDYEISVEGVVYHGELSVAAVCQKMTQPEPYYWEYGHITPPTDMKEDMLLRLKSELQSVVKSLSINNSSIHAEIRVKDRKFYFMEVGARIGGALIPVIVAYSTGANLFSFSSSLAINKFPDLSKIKTRCYAAEYRFNTVHTPLRNGISKLSIKRMSLESLQSVRCVKVKDEEENTIFGDMLIVSNAKNELFFCIEKAKQILLR